METMHLWFKPAINSLNGGSFPDQVALMALKSFDTKTQEQSGDCVSYPEMTGLDCPWTMGLQGLTFNHLHMLG